VKVLCGSSTQLLKITEPERCAYASEMTHPAACKKLQESDTDSPDIPNHYEL